MLFFSVQKSTHLKMLFIAKKSLRTVEMFTVDLFSDSFLLSIKAYLLKCMASIYPQIFSLKCRSSDFISKICNDLHLPVEVCQYTNCRDFKLISPAVKMKSVKICSNK